LPLLLEWKRLIAEGKLLGPRLLVSGPAVEGAWWLDEAIEYVSQDTSTYLKQLFAMSPRYRLGSPAEARTAVDSLIRMGVDLIKFRNLRGDEVRALASAARQRGIPLVGHAPDGISLAEAADSGIRSIEHAETISERLKDLDQAARLAQFEAVARAGTALTPTLVMNVGFRLTSDSAVTAILGDTLDRLDPRRRYVPGSFLLAWRWALKDKRAAASVDWVASHRRQVEDLRLARQAGVPLLVGADAGDLLVYPGISVHEELALLVDQVGLSPLEALRGATIYPARNMGLADSIGRIATGQVADLLLLGADPLAEIRNTRRIEAVVLAGRPLLRQDLDSLLARAERWARASRR
jgi:imidazolonepropionase-like amidohydrolase